MRTERASLLLVLLASVAFVCAGTETAGQRGGGRGTPVPYDDYTGFTKLWDGATFTNWQGESDVWTIEEGTLHADTTKTPGQHHIYYTGPGAIMRDFDLKVEVKLSATGANGGIQYRSRLLHASHGGSIEDPLGKSLPPGITTMAQARDAGLVAPPAPPGGGGGRGGVTGPNGPSSEPNPWQVSGYQCDMDSNNQYTGMLYEGQGRGIVMSPGMIVELLPDRTTARLGTITDTPAALLKPHQGLAGEWQQFQIIARGNTLIHMVNGKVISVIVDDNPTFRSFQGILSLQLEGSGQIWYRNVYVKPLDKPMEIPK
jgi:hypothetical protein